MKSSPSRSPVEVVMLVTCERILEVTLPRTFLQRSPAMIRDRNRVAGNGKVVEKTDTSSCHYRHHEEIKTDNSYHRIVQDEGCNDDLAVTRRCPRVPTSSGLLLVYDLSMRR